MKLTVSKRPIADGRDWPLYGYEYRGKKFGNCQEDTHGKYNLSAGYSAIADLGGKQKYFSEISSLVDVVKV